MREHTDLVRAWRALPPDSEAVLATVVATRGSVYRRPGARMLLTREGWVAGSISGGCIESDLVQTAFDRTASGAALVTYDASAPDDVLLGFGLGCNGAVDVLMQRLPTDGGPLAVIESVLHDRQERWLETYADGSWQVTRLSGDEPLLSERLQPPPALVIFGAGHDAVPLVRIAKEVGWHVTVVDGRSAYAREERLPQADRVLISPPANPIPIEGGASVVVMTHSFANDVAILAWLLQSPASYIGVLGPIHRTRRILEEQGLDGSRLYAPIGLDLGAEGPDEIALAIVAEIQAVRTGGTANHLKGRMTPLHEKKEPKYVGRI
ncbi:XdhC/CoxI family protein [bacterium]|nr:MAG: XdhC/CoxI family protein [bacterium]